MLYANNRFLVDAVRAEEDGFINSYPENVPYFKGNIIATDQFGNQYPMTEEHFYSNYTPVRKMKHVEKKPTYNIDTMASAYAEMGELVKQSNENNEDYIFGVKE